MTPKASPRRLTQRGTRRREQVLEAAARLFAEHSYHGTTVGDICDALGVGKGVFYWYFPSKEALFSELLKDSLLNLRRAQDAAISGIDDPVERLDRGIRASIGFFRDNPGFLQLIRIAARYDSFSGVMEAGRQTVVSDTAAHIKEGMSRGQIRHGDAELMAHGILGAIFHFVEVYYDPTGESRDPPDLPEEAATFCLRGLLA